jgi:hypothetical protein
MTIDQTGGNCLRGALASLDRRFLAAVMRDFRERTLGLVADLDEQQLIGPRLPMVNPPLWEIGHIAWFTEFWLLRHLKKQKPLLPNGDQLYNSTDVAHDTRWELLLPSRNATLKYMGEVLERALEGLDGRRELAADELYFYLLTKECMTKPWPIHVRPLVMRRRNSRQWIRAAGSLALCAPVTSRFPEANLLSALLKIFHLSSTMKNGRTWSSCGRFASLAQP